MSGTEQHVASDSSAEAQTAQDDPQLIRTASNNNHPSSTLSSGADAHPADPLGSETLVVEPKEELQTAANQLSQTIPAHFDDVKNPELKAPQPDRTTSVVTGLQNMSLISENPGASTSSWASEQPLTPPPVPVKDTYLDPTPKTPQASRPPSRLPTSSGEFNEKDGLEESDESKVPDYDEKQAVRGQNAEADKDDESEIHNIMEQFDDESGGPGKEEIMSPRMELAGPMLGPHAQFPPRTSSLDPARPGELSPDRHSQASWPVSPNAPKPGIEKEGFSSPPPVPPKSPPYKSSSPSHPEVPSTGLPPPEPEPDLPFDFHRFLEQLRHRTADPVAKFLRSFLTEFGKKQWMVHEQVKIISDFLAFITNKMAQCEVWREVSDAEFDNAKEGMEKLVMNRLYSQTFSPAIPPPAPLPRSKGKRKDAEKYGPGRRGQHQEDVERDEILAQKIRIYKWVREEHLDIRSVGPNGKKFLALAQQELLKIKGYRAPRDKVICILNCCKVIFGLLKNAKSADTSADSFVPLLIYVVLHANPDHLVSNVQYILRFRNQDKLGGEAGYYLSSLSGAIQFIETLDRTSLTVSDEEFERSVELAVREIAEQHREQEPGPPGQPPFTEKSSLVGPEVTPRNSMDAEYSSPRKRSGQPSSSAAEETEDNPAVGLLRTIQKPLSSIGRIFSEDNPPPRSGPPSQPASTPRLSPAVFQAPRDSEEGGRPGERKVDSTKPPPIPKILDAEEAAARQASAEAAEARRIQRAEHKDVVETLSGMFPNLDKDVIDDVVRLKEGRVGLAVDACLALSAES